jgi:hypothetical protein
LHPFADAIAKARGLRQAVAVTRETAMELARTWSGKYFGWIEEGGLFARDGRHVGEFRKENVFGENGNYLGELREGRLITSEIKKATHSSVGFWPNHNAGGGPSTAPGDEAPREMPDGYEDFPEV